jgi:Zn finger protein HypA/HybF involved in hydrogenase expression
MMDDAIDAGWEPSFFVGDEQQTDEVCPRCAAIHLRLADDGEMELKPAQFEAAKV